MDADRRFGKFRWKATPMAEILQSTLLRLAFVLGQVRNPIRMCSEGFFRHRDIGIR